MAISTDSGPLKVRMIVPYNNGASFVEVTSDPDSLGYTVGGKLFPVGRETALDIITTGKATSFANHLLRTQNRAYPTGEAVVPYSSDWVSGSRVWVHDQIHSGSYSGYQVSLATISMVTLVFSETDVNGPSLCRLEFGVDPFIRPNLPKPVAAGGDTKPNIPGFDYDTSISKFLAGLGSSTDGNVLAGSGAPAGALGKVGDYYIDVAARTIAGPKT